MDNLKEEKLKSTQAISGGEIAIEEEVTPLMETDNEDQQKPAISGGEVIQSTDMSDETWISPETSHIASSYIEPLDFQMAWLDSARNQEELYGGGILADEAGMGKTIQAAMLSLSDRPVSRTLIVSPVLSLSQWATEIANVAEAKVLILEDHPNIEVASLLKYDFVISSYEAVERGYIWTCPHCHVVPQSLRRPHFCGESKSEHQGRKKAKTTGPLHSIEWCRVFLDEGHLLQGEERAIFALRAQFRWILTGRYEEFNPLMRFLQIHPYSFYFCQDCPCICMDLGFWARCPACRHRSLQHISGLELALHNNHGINQYLKEISIRRNRNEIDFQFPPIYVTVRHDAPSRRELKRYTSLRAFIRAEFSTYYLGGSVSVMENYDRILELISRLKQVSIHVDLLDISEDCLLCGREAVHPINLPCRHVFCRDCLLLKRRCPNCFKEFSSNLVNCASLKEKKNKGDAKGPRVVLNTSCTKLEALREEITRMVESDPSAKAVIFSRFQSFLELIRYQLTKNNIGSELLSKCSLRRFNEDPKCKILLTTFKLGSNSINLSIASHVFLMDPGWNPVTDRQAQYRVHSMSQHKPTRVVKFISSHTIEEKILVLLLQKEHQMAGVYDHSNIAEKLSIEDMRFLLS